MRAGMQFLSGCGISFSPSFAEMPRGQAVKWATAEYSSYTLGGIACVGV